MEIFIAFLWFFAGVALTVKGSDMFVDAAGWISDVSGISRVVIGATVVSFATTAPEYFVSLVAVLKGFNDLSIGNAVGSLVCNLGVAFALLALFAPGKVDDKLFGVKGAVMIVSTLLLWIFCFNGTMSVPEGLALLLVYAVFTFINIRYSKDEDDSRKRASASTRDITLNIAKFVGGAAAIVLGSNLIVDNAQSIAVHFGVSEAIIGLTVVAIGTSLPEIVTSIAAIIKREHSLSIGNIIGANTLDATLILATGAFVSGGKLSVSDMTVQMDIPAALILMAAAVLPVALYKKTLRLQGLFLMVIYAAYLIFITWV